MKLSIVVFIVFNLICFCGEGRRFIKKRTGEFGDRKESVYLFRMEEFVSVFISLFVLLYLIFGIVYLFWVGFVDIFLERRIKLMCLMGFWVKFIE